MSNFDSIPEDHEIGTATDMVVVERTETIELIPDGHSDYDKDESRASVASPHAFETEQAGRLRSMVEWARRRKLAVTAGAVALVSTGVTAATADMQEMTGDVVHALPWVGVGVAASETSFIAGGVAMLAAAGVHVRQARKVKKQIADFNNKLQVHDDEQSSRLADSRLFKTGFMLNAAGAIGTTGTLAAGVIEALPPQSWGVLGIGALEMAQTLSTRMAIIGAMQPSRQEVGDSNVEIAAATSTETVGDANHVKNLTDTHEDTVTKAREAVLKSLTENESDHIGIPVMQPVPGKAVEIVAPQTERKREKDAFQVRHANTADIEQIVDLDLKMFRKAYGETLPEREEVTDMMRRRFANIQNGGWMYVCEVNGKIEGFITTFLTNKSPDKFRSWEDSTAHGTLDGVIDPEGDYIYVANLTVGAKASKHNGREKLIGNAFAGAIAGSNAKEAYFESRIPQFRSWLKRQQIDTATLNDEELDALAQGYADSKTEMNGKMVATDFQIRMYEGSGMKRGVLVPDAFNDPESMDYGVVFKSAIPKVPRPFKKIAGAALMLASRSSKVITKIF